MNFTRDTPFAAETRFGAPHFPHVALMRVSPCLTTMGLRSIASRIRRSASSRIARLSMGAPESNKGPEGPLHSHRVFCRFDGPGPDDLAGRLGLEHHRLPGKGIGALPRLGGGLLDDDEFCEAGNEENTGLLQFLVADRYKRLQNALNLFLGHFRLGSDFLNQLRLGHLVCHFSSCWLIRGNRYYEAV